MVQELYPRKILTLPALPAAGGAYENSIVLVGGKAYLSDGTNWYPLGAEEQRLFSLSDASLITGSARWYPDRNITITSVYFSLGHAAVNSNTVIDVKKNGVSIFSGTFPTAAAGAYKSSVISGLAIALTSADYLTVDVTTGSDGQYLTAVIVYRTRG